MNEAIEVIIPLLNPNEPEVQISALHISDGQEVSKGDLLCTLETTKSSNELHAERSGYVAGLNWSAGDRIPAGQRLCWLANDAKWIPPQDKGHDGQVDIPADLRITKPALQLARSSGIELTDLPVDRLVTEATILQMQGSVGVASHTPVDIDTSGGRLIIYGGGGHGKSLIDMIRLLKDYSIEGVIDDSMGFGDLIMGVPVIGRAEDLATFFEQGIQLAVNAVGGIGNISRRIEVFNRLIQAGYAFPALVHPTAFVEASAELDQGAQVFPHAYVGSEVKIGFGTIINTGAVVSHDCALGSYVNVAPGTLLAGGVVIDEGALIGMGVTVNLNVHIGAGVMIGNSAVIKADIPQDQIIRAGQIWPE